ncbi:MAG: symmetrical bis(5'-nucleosyl)-tetraphosphatase [Succinivibrio sp.]
MSTFIFGDLHGCYDEFSKLLEKVKFSESSDELLFTGDLIGRGPKPVETLNLILNLKKAAPDRIHTVLGNHDLNFLAVCLGLRSHKKKDNLDPLLKSEALSEIFDFYVNTPLLYIDHSKKIAMSHAGVYPAWDLKKAFEHSLVIKKVLADPLDRELLLSNMYADHPDIYSDELKYHTINYWRFIINCFTIMRLCRVDLHLDYGHSDCSVSDALADEIYPWFGFGKPYLYDSETYHLFFGHWAALNGECKREHITALDTGCVWGNKLTCYDLENQKLVSVSSKFKLNLIKKS